MLVVQCITLNATNTGTPKRNPENRQVYLAGPADPLHHVVFSPSFKDNIHATGRGRGGKIPYWLEVATHRHYKEHWDHNPGRGVFGYQVYRSISTENSQVCANARQQLARTAANKKKREQQKHVCFFLPFFWQSCVMLGRERRREHMGN